MSRVRPSRGFALWFALRYALWYALWYALRFTPAVQAMAGFRVAGAESRGSAFSEISICAGICL